MNIDIRRAIRSGMGSPADVDDAPRLTDRQREILVWITSYIDDYGYAPTWREIASAHNIGSMNAIRDHLGALERKGYVTYLPATSRTLRVLRRVP